MNKMIGLGLGALVALIFSTNTFANEIIRITSGEWPPYLSKELKYYGVVSRITTEAFALEGIKVEYEFFPWARAYYHVEKGDRDASIGWTPTPERGKIFYMSDVVTDDKNMFFHLKSYPFDWENITDLQGIRIGATIGYTYLEKFDNAEKSGEIFVERVPTDEQNFRKLLKGRIQIFPIAQEVGYFMLNKYFSSEEARLITHHPKPLGKESLALLFSKKIKKNRKMVLLFNKGLKRLKESGKFSQYSEESRRGEYIIKR